MTALSGATGEGMLRDLGREVVSVLADAVMELSVVLDCDGRVSWTSKGFTERTGKPPAALSGLTFEEAISCFGTLSDPAVLADLSENDGHKVLTFLDDAHEQVSFQAMLRSISPAPGKDHACVVVLLEVTHLMAQLARAERARHAIEQRLNFDTETGLPNERRMLEMLQREMRGEGQNAGALPVGLILIEVMEFRQIVDLYGADVGNEVLQQLAATIAQHLPEELFVARLKEHEFGVLLPEVQSKIEMVELAERLAGTLSIEVPTELGTCRVNTLLAMADTKPGIDSPDQLLNNARIAMGFRDLLRRPGQIRVYEPEMRAALEARSRTYNELYSAIENDEIEPFFQPQVRLDDRSVVGFEVLVRWRHPEQGLVPPGLFLEIAEETGLLPQIDEIVMRKAMACIGRWHSTVHPDFRISLNCTGESLRDPNYVDLLMTELDKHGLEPRHVAIEILENVLFGDADDLARVTLDQLQERGFYLEIDDFGTGLASISHLINLNADAVKLDRSLVRDVLTDMASRLVVEATVALSRNLGLSTLAEGTETEEQMAMLQDLGCEFAQGFGIAKPMSFDDTTAWLAHRAASFGQPATPAPPAVKSA